LLVTTLMLAMLPLAAADLTGKWNVDLDIAGNQFKPVFVLKQDGAAVTGTVLFNEEETPLKGTVDGESVKLEYDTVYNGEKYHLVYTGKLDAEGSIQGDTDAGTFVAKRAAAG
jgi:hypothetical protein